MTQREKDVVSYSQSGFTKPKSRILCIFERSRPSRKKNVAVLCCNLVYLLCCIFVVLFTFRDNAKLS